MLYWFFPPPHKITNKMNIIRALNDEGKSETDKLLEERSKLIARLVEINSSLLELETHNEVAKCLRQRSSR